MCCAASSPTRSTAKSSAGATICTETRVQRPERRVPMEIPKSFEPHAIEQKWYPWWESQGLFKPSMDPAAPPFCIQLPPPNVTGTLHMGHAFQHTLIDIMIRYHRMRQDNTLWQLGTDH